MGGGTAGFALTYEMKTVLVLEKLVRGNVNLLVMRGVVVDRNDEEMIPGIDVLKRENIVCVFNAK